MTDQNEPRKVESNIYLYSLPDGSETFEVRLKDRYRRWYPRRRFERRIDARNYRNKLLGDRSAGKNVDTRKTATIGFFDYWQLWMAECRGAVSEGWRKDQQNMARHFIMPLIGHFRLSEVTSRDIGAVIEKMRKQQYANSTIRQIYSTLHKAFEDAIEHFEFLENNPVRKRYCPKIHRSHRNFLHPLDAVKLLDAAKDHYLLPAIYLGLFAGMRPSEIQALEWSSVDFELNQISIRAAFKRKVNRLEPYPKQRNWGVAVMPIQLVTYLQELKIQKVDGGFVAPGSRGGMLEYRKFHRRLKDLCRKAKVTEITPHELRHTATELWVYNKATETDISRQLNHGSLASTKTYMHRTSDRLHAMAANFVLPALPQTNERPRLKIIK